METRERVCPRCGASYSRDPLTSDAPGLCHADEEPLIHRADDAEKIVRHRIQIHEDSLPEISAYYQARGLLHEIDGARAIEAVQPISPPAQQGSVARSFNNGSRRRSGGCGRRGHCCCRRMLAT